MLHAVLRVPEREPQRLLDAERLFFTKSNGFFSEFQFIREAIIRPGGRDHRAAIHLLRKIKIVLIEEGLEKVNESTAKSA